MAELGCFFSNHWFFFKNYFQYKIWHYIVSLFCFVLSFYLKYLLLPFKIYVLFLKSRVLFTLLKKSKGVLAISREDKNENLLWSFQNHSKVHVKLILIDSKILLFCPLDTRQGKVSIAFKITENLLWCPPFFQIFFCFCFKSEISGPPPLGICFLKGAWPPVSALNAGLSKCLLTSASESFWECIDYSG